jgi:shikimate dehydrogenase
MEITGKTAMLLMLADPVEHIRGSLVINGSFDKLGVDAAIVPLHVKPADLGVVVQSVRSMRNVVGLGMTVPHKIAVIPHLDEVTDVARRLGAVNFIRCNADRTLTGTNTDGAGFVAGLVANGFSVSGRKAIVVGAGGVARAIAFALADAGLAELVLANRSIDRAEALAADVSAAVPCCKIRVCDAYSPDAASGMDLVVNATTVGMNAGDPLPLDITGIASGATAAEVVINPAMTPLLVAAVGRGCTTVSGAEMLKPQPRLVAEFFGLLPKQAA